MLRFLHSDEIFKCLSMKQNTHPNYFPKAVFQCACGNKFTAGATVEKITLDVCNKCHPFFTGKGKLIDTGGRVERFRKKFSRLDSVTARQAKAPKKPHKK